MQQRQPRLGDILDDYCPRERRLTNHVVVAMIGDDVKQTRCSTCDADHPYKFARVPRPRRKTEPAALYAQVLAGAAPKKVVHEPLAAGQSEPATARGAEVEIVEAPPVTPVEERAAIAEPAREESARAARNVPADEDTEEEEGDTRGNVAEGPVHRTLIRAQLPKLGGQPPAPRPAPEFTIRQPTGRPDRFRPRQQRAGQAFQGNRSGSFSGNGNGNGNGNARGGGARPFGGRPQSTSRPGNQQGHGRKRSR